MNLRQKLAGRRRWIAISAGILLVVVSGAWLAGSKLGGVIEGKIASQLKGQGWTLQRQSMGWNLWSGFHMEGVKLTRGESLIGMDRFDLDLPLRSYFGGGTGGARIQSSPGTMILRDRDGEIILEDVSFDVGVGEKQLTVKRVVARKGGVAADLSGTIHLYAGGAQAQAPPSGEGPSFRTVRTTLAVLQMQSGEKPFEVSGKFDIGAGPAGLKWNAELKGEGEQIVWHELPLKSAVAEATISESGASISASITLPSGAVEFKVGSEGWNGSPFSIEGTVADAHGKRDDFHGNYQPKQRLWTVAELKGPADLWALAQDVPALASGMSDRVSFPTFPEIELLDATWTRGSSNFKIASLELGGRGETQVKTREGDIGIGALQGKASFDGESWKVRNATGKMLGGNISVSGSYRDSKLSDAKIVAENMNLAEIKAAGGQKSASKGILSVNYSGTVDFSRSALSGRGKMELENAPVIEVPLLDQTYELFTAMIPGVERSKSGRFEADFIAKGDLIEVPRFEATGGNLTVSAKGRVDLKKERVDGVARGKLTGLPGLVTKPLSRLLEMEVGGPYDDIRVKPLGPAKLASNAASGTVGVAVDTLEEAGKITGMVLGEGVKMPFRWLEKKEERRSE